MKKLIIAAFCAFTLFAFASCENGTPAPDTGSDTSRWDPVPEELWGTWEYSLGDVGDGSEPTVQSYVISKDNIIFYSSQDAEGFSLRQDIYEGADGSRADRYAILNASDHSFAYRFHFPTVDNPKEIKVDTYTPGYDDPSTLTFKLAEEAE